jgi:hypothetical protein
MFQISLRVPSLAISISAAPASQKQRQKLLLHQPIAGIIKVTYLLTHCSTYTPQEQARAPAARLWRGCQPAPVLRQGRLSPRHFFRRSERGTVRQTPPRPCRQDVGATKPGGKPGCCVAPSSLHTGTLQTAGTGLGVAHAAPSALLEQKVSGKEGRDAGGTGECLPCSTSVPAGTLTPCSAIPGPPASRAGACWAAARAADRLPASAQSARQTVLARRRSPRPRGRAGASVRVPGRW